MKFIAALILLISANSFAFNPMRHVCVNVKRGEFWAPQRTDKPDDLPLCKFHEAQIGAQTLYLGYSGDLGAPTFAVAAYVNHERNCAGQVVTAVDGDVKVEVCEYSDESVIELQTLLRGPADPKNAELNKALGL